MKTKRNKNNPLGSSFDSWLDEQGEEFKAEVIAGAMKRQLVNRLRQVMKEKGIGVNALQRLLETGPSQVQRLLDPEDTGISLKSIAKVFSSLGLAGQLAFSGEKRKKAA